MRRLALPAIGALCALALAACNTGGPGGPGGPPGNTIFVTAGLDPDAALETVSLDSLESQAFAVEVPQEVVDAGLLYVELDRLVDLEVMTSGWGTVTFSSSSFDYFGSGTQGLSPTGAGAPAPQSIVSTVTCDGSCVLLEPANAGTVYVRVTNRGPVANVSLFAYGDQHGDPNEPANDSLATATPFNGLTDEGAIETVGDVDYWHFEEGNFVTFDLTVEGIPLEAWIVDGNGDPVEDGAGPYHGGEDIQLFAGEYLRVWSQEPWQAASSARSTYYLYVDELPSSRAEEAARRR